MSALLAWIAAVTVLALPNTKAHVEIPDSWKPTPTAGLVAAYKDDTGGVLAVARADVPNPDAWKSETRQAYADSVDRGIRAKLPGARKATKKLSLLGEVPALDVEVTRDDGATVLVRVLLFRTYALSLAIEVPANGDLAGARTMIATFSPTA